MNNPFQEQFLKAGIVNKQQVKKANQQKAGKKNKRQQRISNNAAAEQARLKAKQAEQKKAERDRQLNQQKQEQARKKAISIEINQLITDNCLQRGEKCEIVYNFAHRNKVHRIYINADMKSRLIQGKLGIARIEGRYELVPLAIAEKIQQRNDKRIVLLEDEKPPESQAEDPYADYQIPDDITW